MAFRLYLYYTMYTSCLVVRSDGPLPLTLTIVIVDATKVSKHQSLGGGHLPRSNLGTDTMVTIAPDMMSNPLWLLK